ncbi:MAG TPA: hydroxymethylbilane synthase [Rhodanobacteraceae bacterium]|jgi:hydroxymethylbilane synthase|nr:hydroxymethylbilane synthase [Rhodanobacteraceae bacterium]
MSASLLRIATRKSPLALWQAEHVAQRLRDAHPGLAVELLPLSTRGDEVLDRSLSVIGGKGLFLKELEVAIAEGRADLAVHSLKDVPAQLDPQFELAAILQRADGADAFVSNDFASLDALPEAARVGTSSLRRTAQLRARRADLEIVDLRGNVGTRLAKLDRGDYAAIILAVAGLERLGFTARIRSRLAPPDWLPAPGQAAIAVETRAGDARTIECVKVLDDANTRRNVSAERALNAAMGGDCTMPLGAWCETATDGTLHLRGLLGDARDGRLLRADARGDDPVAVGGEVARLLRERGADALLRSRG